MKLYRIFMAFGVLVASVFAFQSFQSFDSEKLPAEWVLVNVLHSDKTELSCFENLTTGERQCWEVEA